MNSNVVYTLSLMVTEKCNLNCIYCYEHNKSFRNMDFDIAKNILDQELTKFDFNNRLIIDFFGGEPFANFALIKKIVLYVEEKYTNKLSKINFFATTNGTLVNDEVKSFLMNKKEKFVVGLSLDGTKEANDINRPNSFDLIDKEFFLLNYPNQPIKMTISASSLPYLFDSIVYLTDLGYKIDCNLALGVEWDLDEVKPILIRELDKLIEFYLKNPNLPRARILNYDIKYISLVDRQSSTVKKWCGSGKYMATYSITGEKYPCQMFVPISSNRPKKVIKIDADIPRVYLDKKCKSCLAQPICPTCYGINYSLTGNPYKIEYVQCELQKVIIKANAKLQALFWKNKLLKLDKKDEQALLRAIRDIQSL